MNFLSSLKGWKCTVLSIILYCVPDTLKVNSGIQHFDGQHKAAQEQRIDSQDWPSLSLLYSYIPPPIRLPSADTYPEPDTYHLGLFLWLELRRYVL